MKKLLTIAAILALAGCAQTGSVLQGVNDSLKAANKALAGGSTIQTLGDAGGGAFFIIETERWAFDSIDELVELLEKIKAVL